MEGLGRLEGRSGVVENPRLSLEATAGAGQHRQQCMALSRAAWGALRLKKLDSAGQKERNVSQGGCEVGTVY